MQYQSEAAKSTPVPQIDKMRCRRAALSKWNPNTVAMTQNNRCSQRTGNAGNAVKLNATMSGRERNAAVNQSPLPFAPVHIALQKKQYRSDRVSKTQIGGDKNYKTENSAENEETKTQRHKSLFQISLLMPVALIGFNGMPVAVSLDSEICAQANADRSCRVVDRRARNLIVRFLRATV